MLASWLPETNDFKASFHFLASGQAQTIVSLKFQVNDILTNKVRATGLSAPFRGLLLTQSLAGVNQTSRHTNESYQVGLASDQRPLPTIFLRKSGGGQSKTRCL
eukprot:TRINITY_DN36419_c0_g1_i1.p3 TRINITY_DN36419_c0_g1~~TRINITY_DN36419_c0_g1_i1.p3  ORF type:complete len:104 (-),score=4.82 TRINITY_DN36419_c0_g1_i1:76-387(-)